ncbi:hypothetical protein [Lysobacter arvi]|uniref:Uncharacterized protein n=1 Tax=Lysobacter arvi TaxID=3038776 RepID=A0ABU1CE48_9GAMM|nr:hypothetical protein [Lysobacter arvi]MDR0183456.1 hypothetical protein [Lysobacter arvi]
MTTSEKNQAKAKAHLTWRATTHVGAAPAINDQFVAMNDAALCLRSFMPKESAVMGRLHSSGIFVIGSFSIWMAANSSNMFGAWLMLSFLVVPIVFSFLLFRYLRIIRRQSDFWFNRVTQQVYWHDGKQLYVGDWKGVQAGPRSVTAPTGGGLSTSFYLEMYLPWCNAPEGTQWPEWVLRLESNDVIDPRREYIVQVWEYIRTFMAEGPMHLPPPQEEKWWWWQPPRRIYLSPKQALLRYLPWRTGVPGEETGKQWWMLPFWALTFPYNMFLMLCWWATCTVFKVRPAAPPMEAFQGTTGQLVEADMAAKGMWAWKV